EKIEASELGGLLGLLHDLGKYDEAFQRRLYGDPRPYDHSTAGACILAGRYGKIGKLLAYAVAGHHSGLPPGTRDESRETDRRSLEERLKTGFAQAEQALARAQADGLVLPKIPTPTFKPEGKDHAGLQLVLFLRMLFSCLVDADRLETERFYQSQDRGSE